MSMSPHRAQRCVSSHFLPDLFQDSAVIVGFNAAFDENDGMYAPNSYEVAATVSSYNTLFCNEYKVTTDLIRSVSS